MKAVLASMVVLLLQAPAPPTPWFETVAEGWTARDERSSVDLAFRMFSVPDMAGHCAKAPSPARLVAKGTVTLLVGEWFQFSSLRIVAVDAAGRPLAPVPIMLDLEKVEPRLFALTNQALNDGGVTPTRTGRFRFRARTICRGTSAEGFGSAVVRTR